MEINGADDRNRHLKILDSQNHIVNDRLDRNKNCNGLTIKGRKEKRKRRGKRENEGKNN